MKKKILILLIVLLQFSLIFSEEYNVKKYAEIENTKEGVYRRKNENVAPYDDETGNFLFINERGDFYIYNWDKLATFKISNDRTNIDKKYEHDFSDLSCMQGLKKVTNNYLYYTWTTSSYLAISLTSNERKFKVCINDLIRAEYLYYDEESDILFLKDSDEKLYSIVHPGMDDEENRKNFKNPEETLEIIRNQKYENMSHLGLYKDKFLTVNEKVYYWAGQTINGINYQIFMNKEVDIWNDEGIEISCKDPAEQEQIESIAIHPSGDIYILRMNWNTNTHNLYRIENTWDSKWREQWYEEHPDAN